jgi:hypothetical protein
VGVEGSGEVGSHCSTDWLSRHVTEGWERKMATALPIQAVTVDPAAGGRTRETEG